MKLTGMRIRNFGPLKNAVFGSLAAEGCLAPLAVFTGSNGTGKTYLFSCLRFLSMTLNQGVENALAVFGQYDLKKIKTQGEKEPQVIHLQFQKPNNDLFDYCVTIDCDKTHRPVVVSESLYFTRADQQNLLLELVSGKGNVWNQNTNNRSSENICQAVSIESRALGLGVFGLMKQYPLLVECLKYIQNWHFIDILPTSIHALPLAHPNVHLNRDGENLANVIKHLELEKPDRLKRVCLLLSELVPAVEHFNTETTPDGRLLLAFYEKGLSLPLFCSQMSGGILKLLACLVAVENKDNPSLICIENIEQNLYWKILAPLLQHFRRFLKTSGHCQILLTSDSRHILDLVGDDELNELLHQAAQ